LELLDTLLPLQNNKFAIRLAKEAQNKDNRVTRVDVVEQKDWIIVQYRPSSTEKYKKMRPAE